MIGPVVADDVEARPVLGHRLHLTREQVDLRGGLGLVGVADLQQPLAHLALPPLPNVPQPPLGPLVEVARPPVAQGGVALGLVQGVLAQRVGTVLERKKGMLSSKRKMKIHGTTTDR